MPSVNLDEAIKKKDMLAEQKLQNPKTLPFDFFLKPGNKTTKLLANSSDNKPVEGRNRWFEYDLKQPTFLTYILVSSDNYSDYDKFSFEWISVDGKTHTHESKFSDKSVYAWVNDVVKTIRFRPPSKWLSSPNINSVTIAGIPHSDVGKFLSDVGTIEKHRDEVIKICEKAIENAATKNNEITTLEAKILSLNSEMETLNSRKSDISRDNNALTLKNTDLLTTKLSLEDSVKISNDRMSKIDEEISVKITNRKRLSEEISEKTTELNLLQTNINVFPTEIVGFANQSSINISLYWKLIAVPIAIIAIMFSLLIFSAADLTTIVTRKPNIDIYAIFLTRLPYVAIATVIVTACYKICRVFITEMIKINQQKLSLTKISIIAKDIASASESGLDLNDKEIFQLRSQLKMELLRDHMKEYISKDFKISLPLSITSILNRQKNDNDCKGSPDSEEDLLKN